MSYRLCILFDESKFSTHENLTLRDGKTWGYWGYIRANFFQAVLIFWLYTRKQTISTVLFCTVLKAIL